MAIDEATFGNISYYGPSVVGLTTNDQVQFSVDIKPHKNGTSYDSLNARDREALETCVLETVARRLKSNPGHMSMLRDRYGFELEQRFRTRGDKNYFL